MTETANATEEKSSNYLAFMHYMRTGERLTSAQYEQKYNHNHDELGKFTYAANASGGNGASHHPPPARAHSRTSSAPAPTHRAAVLPTRQTAHPAPAATPQPRGSLQREGYTPWTQVGSHPARVYRTKAGAAIIDPRSGNPMLVPQGVSIRNTIGYGLVNNSFLKREAATVAFLPDGMMDFQRTHSNLPRVHGVSTIDQRFIAIGNYNFGVYAAASGMSLSDAMAGAGALYRRNTGRRSSSSRNEILIVSGYRDFISNNVGD
jgi:hypothetical protein